MTDTCTLQLHTAGAWRDVGSVHLWGREQEGWKANTYSEEVLRRIGQSPTAGVVADWPLLLAGAGNPIGHLRVKEAAAWLTEHAGPLHGFSDDEVVQRGDEFAEYLASHGLFVAGSSGVQGEWPKILLTRADELAALT